jgi:hypothetical protein
LLGGIVNMEFLLNDLCFHGQFDEKSFVKAIDQLMTCKNLIREFGQNLYCHRNITQVKVTNTIYMYQAVNFLNREKRNAFMSWMTKQGPFWNDEQRHSSDDYMQCNDLCVTDSAIGEVAFRVFCGDDHRLLSIQPSKWIDSTLAVFWYIDDINNRTIDIFNHNASENLLVLLSQTAKQPTSWQDLSATCRSRFSRIIFSDDSFQPLKGYPFSPSAAKSIIEKLAVLEKMICCVNERGDRTNEGHQLYQQHFTGDKSWFSDSSHTEKNEFKSELTFKHPMLAGETLFCSWHAKIKTPQIRIHFSWPISFNSSLYVVYIGPKITKR